MEHITQSNEEKALEIAKRLEAYTNDELINIDCLSSLDELRAELLDNENLLIEFLNNKNPKTSMKSLEFGPALYLLNQYIPSLRNKPFCLPPTKIDVAKLEKWNDDLKGSGMVYSDGTIFSYDKYCQFDKYWFTIALGHYLELKAGFRKMFKPFPNNPQVVTAPNKESITIAITGDWGSGFYKDGSVDCPSQLVGNAISAIGADYTIHLGDVYYAGTNNELIFKGEEQHNFVDLWQRGSLGSFTLNSNHEMYDGAKGLFEVALGKPGESLFSLQKGTSFFALEFNNWVIIGLDSGYYDTSLMYMDGSIGNAPNTEQADFIKKLKFDGKQVIVLTHHVPIQFDGTTVPTTKKYPITLWNQVTTALGQGGEPRYPDFWYYGHTHNGVAYSKEAPGVKDFKTPSNNTPMLRCNGHGSLPFGCGKGLIDKQGNLDSAADYMAHTPMPNPSPKQKNRVLNGFATLTLKNGEITESFYEVSANKKAEIKWTNTVNY